MSGTQPGSGASAAPEGDAQTTSGRRQRFRGCVRGLVIVTAASAAIGGGTIGGGLIGYKLGKEATAPVLSAPARAAADGFAAPTRLAAVAPEIEEVRSDFQSRLAAMLREQKRLKAALENAKTRHEEARRELGRTERAFAEASRDLHETDARLARLSAEDRRESAEAQSEVQELRLELAAAESEKEGLSQTLGTLASTMEKVIAERDDAAARAESLDEHVATLSEKQDRLLARIEDAARISLDGMQDLIEKTGLDVDHILGETRESYTGSGGPFEALADEVSLTTDTAGTEARLAALMTDLEQVNLLRSAAMRMPIGHPAPRNTRETSRFGPRRDPLGRGRAMHKGHDFAGPTGTPIYATGDGEVTFAGRQRGYGRIVIVRHAFGLETRFAHLNKARVKVGQQVKRGQHIADMGNTGRSTGTHLHYEVRLGRQAMDPANFINAATGLLAERS